jgi:hypothetical protein
VRPKLGLCISTGTNFTLAGAPSLGSFITNHPFKTLYESKSCRPSSMAANIIIISSNSITNNHIILTMLLHTITTVVPVELLGPQPRRIPIGNIVVAR